MRSKRFVFLLCVMVAGLSACSAAPAPSVTAPPTVVPTSTVVSMPIVASTPTKAATSTVASTPTVAATPTAAATPTKAATLTVAATLAAASTSNLSPLPSGFPKIDRRPVAAPWLRGSLKEIPAYNLNTPTRHVDLRAYDLSQLDLRDSLNDLLYASFDSQTKWPAADKLPADFDWQHIMELGKNPGLGIRQLHAQGITGKGVGIAIIDLTLLVDHEEYKDQLRLYEEADDIQNGWQDPQMHGPAVASLAVGKTVGVAPAADLYYIATTLCIKTIDEPEDFACLAHSIRRILEINRQLPEDRKIRVLSISNGWDPDSKGKAEAIAAAQEAKAAGLLVISSNVDEVHGFKFQAMGRTPLADPDQFGSYEPGLFWAKRFYEASGFPDSTPRLLVPMDSRTIASLNSVAEYAFYRVGGWSWSIPYIAGMYALTAQVNPSITPDEFWALALKTGRTIELKRDGQTIPFGSILDPVALIESLQTK